MCEEKPSPFWSPPPVTGSCRMRWAARRATRAGADAEPSLYSDQTFGELILRSTDYVEVLATVSMLLFVVLTLTPW